MSKEQITAERVSEIVLATLASAEDQSSERNREIEISVSSDVYWAAFAQREFQHWIDGVVQPYVFVHGFKCRIDLKLKGEVARLAGVRN